MDGEQIREFHMPRFAIALAAIALFAAVLVPTAGATSPSQDQYGSALPGVGGPNGGGNPNGSGGSEPPKIQVAPSGQKSDSKASNHSGGNGGHSNAGSKGGSSHKGNGNAAKGSSNNGQPVAADTAGQSVPHIAADSAGDSWVPWFIGGLLALAAAGGIIVYRNRRRAAQP
jgi:hypothetical protein